jgi:hypothetical protein
MIHALRSKLSRVCVIGLSVVALLYPLMGCDQSPATQPPPVMDFGTTGAVPPTPTAVKVEPIKGKGAPIKQPGGPGGPGRAGRPGLPKG